MLMLTDYDVADTAKMAIGHILAKLSMAQQKSTYDLSHEIAAYRRLLWTIR